MHHSSPGGPLRVLLVEHTQADIDLSLLELKKAGVAVCADVAQTPEEFGQRLLQNHYDIILADYRLPDWTGLDALAMLRHLGQDTPFLLVTGTLGDEVAVECIKQGVTDYVLKERLARLPLAVQRALEEAALRRERAHAQRALHDSEASFRLLFANNPLPMWVYDKESLQFLQVNDAAMEHYGYAREEFLGVRITDLWPPEDLPRLLEGMTAGQTAGELAGEWRHRLKDGRTIDVEVFSHRLEFAERDAALVVAQDVTERKRAEEALRRSETRYRELVENATYGIFRATLSGKFLDVNPALAHMLGYDSKAELLSRDLATDVYHDPAARERIIEQYSQTGRVDGAEVEWKRKDGSIITVRLSGRAVGHEPGHIEELEVIIEDITGRRAVEKQMRQVQKFEAIGQLAGGIAHDFNNVIGAILGWGEIGLEQVPAESPLRNHFRKICEQAQRAAGLTRQLLAFARRQVLEPRNINLNYTITDLLTMLGRVIGSEIELKTVSAPDLGAVRADPSQIEQVLMNLCLNARDAMPHGGRLTIETRNVEVGEDYTRLYSYVRPGPYVQLSVSDTGIGMDAATREHIFEPFFTTKEPGKGTGLGLATVYGVVKQHGGFVHVYSEPGRGSTFHVYLPVSDEALPPRDRKEKAGAAPVRRGTETILVAEDHDGLREIACATLERLGYCVIAASDGQQALETFQQRYGEIDLVLLDVVMPKLDGQQLYVHMCAVKPEVPAIFTTGYSTEAAALSELVEKGVAVLPKPYTPAQLGRKVREALDDLMPAPAAGPARSSRGHG